MGIFLKNNLLFPLHVLIHVAYLGVIMASRGSDVHVHVGAFQVKHFRRFGTCVVHVHVGWGKQSYISAYNTFCTYCGVVMCPHSFRMFSITDQSSHPLSLKHLDNLYITCTCVEQVGPFYFSRVVMFRHSFRMSSITFSFRMSSPAPVYLTFGPRFSVAGCSVR